MRKKNQSAEFIKECLSQALVNLMKTKDYEKITISDICQEAGFGRTTYYRYYTNDKSQLLRYIARIRWAEYKSKNIINDDNYGHELFKHIYNYKDFFICLKKQNLIEIIYQILFDEMGPKPNEPELLTYGKSLFVGAYFGVIYQWIIYGCADSPETVKSKIEQGFAYAIANAKKNDSP